MWLSKHAHQLPERVEVYTCSLLVYTNGDPETNPGSFARAISQVNMAYFLQLQAEEPQRQGFPAVFTIGHQDRYDDLYIYPPPDKKYYAVFRYCPVMKEI